MVSREASMGGLTGSEQDMGTAAPGGHSTEVDQESRLLSSATRAAAISPSFDWRCMLLAGVATVAVVAMATCVATRPDVAIRTRRSTLNSLQQGGSFLNLEIRLTNIPGEKLFSHIAAKTQLETEVEEAFEGRFAEYCQDAEAEVVARDTDETATVVQVFLLLADGAKFEDFAVFVMSEEERKATGELLTQMIGSLDSVQEIKTSDVIVDSMVQAPQDGEFQYLVGAAEAGSDILQMGETRLDVGAKLSIGGRLVKTIHEATVLGKLEGNLTIDTPLPVAYPRGALVVEVDAFSIENTVTGETPATAEVNVPSPASPTSAPSMVNQVVMLQGLPRDLSAEQRAGMQEQIEQTYAIVLNKSPLQVSAVILFAQRRRLRALAESMDQGTQIDISVETSAGQTAEQLQVTMDDSKSTLGTRVTEAVEQKLDIGPGTLEADVGDAITGSGNRGALVYLVCLGVASLCILGAIVFCVCLSCGKQRTVVQSDEVRERGVSAEQTAVEATAAGSLAVATAA